MVVGIQVVAGKVVKSGHIQEIHLKDLANRIWWKVDYSAWEKVVDQVSGLSIWKGETSLFLRLRIL